MSNTFVYADLHYGHQATCTVFKWPDGRPLRPWDTQEEMTETLIQNHNEVVRSHDKVYILGDLVMHKKHLHHFERLNGDLVLIKGNHDIFHLDLYLKYFRDIRACQVIDKCVLTHIPIHPASIERWRMNVHGHLHSNEILLDDGTPDPRYICVSIEQPWMNFRPIAWEELKKVAISRGTDLTLPPPKIV